MVATSNFTLPPGVKDTYGFFNEREFFQHFLQLKSGEVLYV